MSVGRDDTEDGIKKPSKVDESRQGGLQHFQPSPYSDPTKLTQPMPKEGIEHVTTFIIEALHKRREIGIKKYGTSLMTWNGRDPLADAMEEELDRMQYLVQARMERADLNERVAFVERVNKEQADTLGELKRQLARALELKEGAEAQCRSAQSERDANYTKNVKLIEEKEQAQKIAQQAHADLTTFAVSIRASTNRILAMVDKLRGYSNVEGYSALIHDLTYETSHIRSKLDSVVGG